MSIPMCLRMQVGTAVSKVGNHLQRVCYNGCLFLPKHKGDEREKTSANQRCR